MHGRRAGRADPRAGMASEESRLRLGAESEWNKAGAGEAPRRGRRANREPSKSGRCLARLTRAEEEKQDKRSPQKSTAAEKICIRVQAWTLHTE